MLASLARVGRDVSRCGAARAGVAHFSASADAESPMRGNVVRFPRMLLTASRTRGVELPPNQKAFTCDPRTTNHEIKEYLTKIYGLDVVKVHTSNYDGAFS